MSRDWKLGKTFIVRHAGFPFDWLEELGVSAATAQMTARVLQIESRVLEAAAANGGEKKRAQAAEALRRGRFPEGLAVEGAKTLEPEWKSAREALREAYASDRQRLRQQLRARASDPLVQEAIFFSNPAMYENVWARYVQSDGSRDNSDSRRVERQVYTYLQRLCGKNETTSFFGPMAYGELTGDRGYELEVDCATSMRRRTFFAFWALLELANAVGREPSLRPHLPLRRNPLFEVREDSARCAPLGLSLPLRPDQHALIAAVSDGGTLAGAARIAGLAEDSAEALVRPLLKATVLLRGLTFASDDLEAFSTLREQVAKLPAGEARDRWMDRFRQLEAWRSGFEGAGLEDRRALLTAMEGAFTEYTGVAARRGEGQIYSDRLILYEEARSRFSIRIGEALARQMEQSLSGPLELSAAYGEQVQSAYKKEVVQALGPQPEPVDFLTYAIKTRPDEVSGSRFSPVPPFRMDSTDTSQSELSPDLLGTSSPGGRYALPDVCLSGPPAGSGKRGDYGVLLSRVHHHLLLYSWLATHCPDRAQWEAVSRRWLQGEPTAKGLVGLSVRRRNKGFYSFPGRRFAYSVRDPLDLDPDALHPLSVRVSVADGDVQLLGPHGEKLQLYLPLDDFTHYPPFAALSSPLVLHVPITSASPHLPRIRITGATYQRERWTLATTGFRGLTGIDLLLEMTRQRRAAGFARFVFVRTDTERKPFLIDTESPFALDLLRHLADGGERMSVDEMLPAPEDLWLRDERGRYTCEMRMQAERWTVEPPQQTRSEQ